MVPVEEDEYSVYPICRERFLEGHPEVDSKEVPDQIYFYPSNLRPRTPKESGNQYDDEEGYYLVREGDHLIYRYEILKTLGKGSFAQVVSARDHRTGSLVAIKITRNTELDHKFAEGEAKLLRYLM